jgi:hypothetical protein
MSRSNSEALGFIEHQVRAYFDLHPHAADTIVGIRSWWLRDTCPDCSLWQLQEVLQRMLASGELVCTTNLSGETIYSRR